MRRIIYNGPAGPVVTSQPSNQANYDGLSVTFNIAVCAKSPTYQWQENTGSGFSDISNGGNYAGATTVSLTVSNITYSMYDYQYRCIVSSSYGVVISSTAYLKVVDFPSYSDISANPYTKWSRSTQALMMLNTKYFENKKVVLGSPISGTNNYEGSVVAPNKFHYGIPHTDTTVIKVDADNNSYTQIGSLAVGTDKWVGGCLAYTGIIYGCPHSATAFLKIDPTTDTITTFGSLSASTTKWAGSCSAWNGKIYHAPFSATTILVLDPSNDTSYEIANSGGVLTGTNKWVGILPGADGRLYCVPYNATYVLVIDPTNDTYTTIGSSLTGSSKWSGADLSWTGNGLIFCCPYTATTVLVIDSVNATVSQIGSGVVPAGGGKWESIKSAANGIMYSEQLNESRILRIDPSFGATDSAVSLITGFGGTPGWVGQNLSHTGSIIAMPFTNSRPYKFLQADPLLDDNAFLGIFNNRY